MNELITYLILIFFILIINNVFKNKNFLINNTGQNHQVYTVNEKIPLSGGLIILIFFYLNHNYLDQKLIIYLTIFFSIGLFSDLSIIKSPGLRFILQSIFLIIFIFDTSLKVIDLRIEFLNELLNNKYLNLLFLYLCFSVLLNGTNFIDGNNGLSIGYFLIISFIVYRYSNYEIKIILPILVVLTILIIFNLLNKLYLGDNGVYVLVIFFGYMLIDLFSKNSNLSPYFIVNLLWYPAFETLFSILRKLKYRHSPMAPDTLHLHQLIFNVYIKKFLIKNKLANSLTGVTINSYNFVVLYLFSMFPEKTNMQILCITISVFTYVLTYIFLKRIKN